MADDASKLKPEPKAEPKAQPKRVARPRPDRNAFEAGRDAMDRHPIVMARLAE